MYGNMNEFRTDTEGSCEAEDAIARSDVRARTVSAATIPLMECPIRIVLMEGSTVGEGVLFKTSRSMTFSWSLLKNTMSICDDIMSDKACLPVCESTNTFSQVSPSLEFRIYDHPYVDFRKRMANEGLKMLGEASYS